MKDMDSYPNEYIETTLTNSVTVKNKLIAVESGGDWADASVRYLVMITDIDPKKLYETYEKLEWDIKHSYSHSFSYWLIGEGYARYAGESDITVINDDQ